MPSDCAAYYQLSALCKKMAWLAFSRSHWPMIRKRNPSGEMGKMHEQQAMLRRAPPSCHVNFYNICTAQAFYFWHPRCKNLKPNRGYNMQPFLVETIEKHQAKRPSVLTSSLSIYITGGGHNRSLVKYNTHSLLRLEKEQSFLHKGSREHRRRICKIKRTKQTLLW